MFSTMKRRTKVAVIAVYTALAVTSVSPASAQGLSKDVEDTVYGSALMSAAFPVMTATLLACAYAKPLVAATSGPDFCTRAVM